MIIFMLFIYLIANDKFIESSVDRLFKKTFDTTSTYKHEIELVEKLLKDYNKKMRPPNSMQVKFAFNLNQIINLVEKDQIVILNAFIDHEWIDMRLQWDPNEYGNLSIIRVSTEKLWT